MKQSKQGHAHTHTHAHHTTTTTRSFLCVSVVRLWHFVEFDVVQRKKQTHKHTHTHTHKHTHAHTHAHAHARTPRPPRSFRLVRHFCSLHHSVFSQKSVAFKLWNALQISAGPPFPSLPSKEFLNLTKKVDTRIFSPWENSRIYALDLCLSVSVLA